MKPETKTKVETRNFTIPQGLNGRMKKFMATVNWSAVVTNAIIKKLEELEK